MLDKILKMFVCNEVVITPVSPASKTLLFTCQLNGKVWAVNGICSWQHDFRLNNLSLGNKFVRFGLVY